MRNPTISPLHMDSQIISSCRVVAIVEPANTYILAHLFPFEASVPLWGNFQVNQ